MKQAIVDLLSSKKFLTAAVAVAVTCGAKYGLALDSDFVLAILGLFAVLIGAQGAADVGKGAAEAKAAGSTTVTQTISASTPAAPPTVASGEINP